MASYTEAGYNEFLSRSDSQVQENQLDPLASDQFLSETSGSKIQGGILQTNDGDVQMDLEAGLFRVSNGSQDLIQLGKLPDGTVGLIIKDRDGNTLIQFTGDTNLIQSAQKNLELNFDTVQLLVRDEGGSPRVLIGKDENGF